MHGPWTDYIYWMLVIITEPLTYLVVGAVIVAPLLWFLRKDAQAKKKREQDLL